MPTSYGTTCLPIYAHRFIPNSPNELGNPVFSIYQTDIIYYGIDLIDYFSNEFDIEVPKSYITVEQPKVIPFWSELVI